jgi:hypothetical protein
MVVPKFSKFGTALRDFSNFAYEYKLVYCTKESDFPDIFLIRLLQKRIKKNQSV